MPFGYRKSIRIAKGVRMTFSKSGISTSVGGKGYRVTTGPRGTYVTVGASGIYYRQKVGGFVGSPNNRNTNYIQPANINPSNFNQEIPVTPHGTPIETANIDQLIEHSSGSALEQLNEVSSQPSYALGIAIGGGVLGLLSAQIHPMFFWGVGGLGLYIASIARGFDKQRRTFNMHFQMDADAQKKWQYINESLGHLSRASRIWRIITEDKTYDFKRNAGASSILNRTPSSVTQESPKTLECNVNPYCLHLGSQSFYFLPDRIYISEGGRFAALDYKFISVQSGTTRFIEEQGVPNDAKVVGQTWRYVNKSGGPDRRFNNNVQIPIVEYGVVEIKSASGVNIVIHTSSIYSSQKFVEFFHMFQGHNLYNSRQNAENSQSSHSNSSDSDSPHPKPNQQGSRPRKKKIPTADQPFKKDCFGVLGLSPSCTKDEASNRYRFLAMSYHPDKVNTMPEEFRELATRKLQEFNDAYAEIKRLRGW